MLRAWHPQSIFAQSLLLKAELRWHVLQDDFEKQIYKAKSQFNQKNTNYKSTFFKTHLTPGESLFAGFQWLKISPCYSDEEVNSRCGQYTLTSSLLGLVKGFVVQVQQTWNLQWEEDSETMLFISVSRIYCSNVSFCFKVATNSDFLD